MRPWKKNLIRFSYVVFGLCALLAAGRFMPFPIEGNWVIPYQMPCVHDDDCHNFLRFENGKMMYLSDTHFPPVWLGTYKRKGWGKYETDDAISPVVYHSTFCRLTRTENPNDGISCPFFFRDFRIWTCRKAVNHPSNEWMTAWLRVTGTPEKRIFSSQRGEQTKEQLAEWLERTFMPPLTIDTASNEVPSSLIETLVENGMDYIVHTNQEWIVSEMRKEKPGWSTQTKRSFRFNYSLVIAPPPQDMTEDIFYLMNEGPLSLQDVESKIKTKRWNRDCWENDAIHLYAKNGVLPDDVKQLFDQFDIAYTVLDERVLYRGKSKDPYAKKGDAP